MLNRHEQVSKTLSNCARSVERRDRFDWSFVLSNGHDLVARARIEGEWLLLDAPLPYGARTDDGWRLLQLNAGLVGLSKFALLPEKRTASICAEIPLHEEIDLSARLRETCAGFKAALNALYNERSDEQGANGPSAQSNEDAQTSFDLRQLCEEAGWNFKERAEGKLAIDLDVRGEFYQALAEKQKGQGLLISVELARGHVSNEEHRQSMASLLLKASGIVRMARPAVEGVAGQTLSRFETSFAHVPCAAELNEALSALSIARALCGQEVGAIQDVFVANNYFQVWSRES